MLSRKEISLPRGGARPNSGPDKRYGDKPTVRVVRLIPKDRVAELDAWLRKKIKAWRK